MLFLLSKLSNKKTFKIFLYFLTLTFFYAFLYKYFGKFDSAKDGKKVGARGELTFFDAFYFSLATQTTVGYGDIVPDDQITKAICISQLLITIIIMAIEI